MTGRRPESPLKPTEIGFRAQSRLHRAKGRTSTRSVHRSPSDPRGRSSIWIFQSANRRSSALTPAIRRVYRHIAAARWRAAAGLNPGFTRSSDNSPEDSGLQASASGPDAEQSRKSLMVRDLPQWKLYGEGPERFLVRIWRAGDDVAPAGIRHAHVSSDKIGPVLPCLVVMMADGVRLEPNALDRRL